MNQHLILVQKKINNKWKHHCTFTIDRDHPLSMKHHELLKSPKNTIYNSLVPFSVSKEEILKEKRKVKYKKFIDCINQVESDIRFIVI